MQSFKPPLVWAMGFVTFAQIFFRQEIGTWGLVLIAVGFLITIAGAHAHASYRARYPTVLIAISTVVIVLCGLLLFRSQHIVQTILVAGVISGIGYLTYILTRNIPAVRSLMELVVSPLLLLESYVSHFFTSHFSIFHKNDREHPVDTSKTAFPFKPVAVGIVLGIPIAIILVTLFSLADPIYTTWIGNIVNTISWDIVWRVIDRLIYSLWIALFLIPLVLMRARKEPFHSPLASLERFSLVREMTVIMIMAALVIASFIVVQWPYVFANVAAETDLSAFGINTYSEYVRKGFVQLINTVVIIFCLVWIGHIVTRNKKDFHTWHSVFVIVQWVVLLLLFVVNISVLRRIWLYQDLHGWSLVRLYGGVFIAWISMLMVTLALRHIWRTRWVYIDMACTVIIIVFIGLFNAESFIVAHHPPTVNKRVDYVYLSRMSADGYQGWLSAYEHAEKILNRDYPQGSTITKEQRREIAYAIIVNHNLLAKYNTLVRTYGTAEEKRTYAQLFRDVAIQENSSWDIEPLLYNNFFRQIEVDDYSAEDQQAFIYNYMPQPRVVSRMPSFEPRSYGRSAYIHRLDTDIDTVSVSASVHDGSNLNIKPTSPFMWNGAEARAYRILQEQNFSDKAIRMMDVAWKLKSRISSQSGNERDYDYDISLDSPLL